MGFWGKLFRRDTVSEDHRIVAKANRILAKGHSSGSLIHHTARLEKAAAEARIQAANRRTKAEQREAELRRRARPTPACDGPWWNPFTRNPRPRPEQEAKSLGVMPPYSIPRNPWDH